MSDINEYIKNKNCGLKSINTSLSITPALRPGLVNNLKHRALAQNISLLLIPDTHYKKKD
jgi:hypothetical protein